MSQQQSGPYRTHTRAAAAAQNYRPPTCEDATATDMSDSQPEMATRQHQRESGGGQPPRPPLQRSATTGPGTGRYAPPPAAMVGSAYQQSGYTAHPFTSTTTAATYNPLFGTASMPMNYQTPYQTPAFSGRYASNTSAPCSYGGQYSQQAPFIYPDTGYPDPRRFSYSNDDYYPPEPAATQYPSRPPPPAPRPPRQNYGYQTRSATPAPKTERPPPPPPPKKHKAPARPPPPPKAASDDAAADRRMIKREMSKLKKQMAKLEVEHEDLRSDTGRVRSEFLLPSPSLANRNSAASWESVQTLEHIRRLIDDFLRKAGARSSSPYTDSRVDALEALIRDKMAFERRDSLEPRDDRSFEKRVIEVLQDYETQVGRRSTREEKRRSGGQRSTTSSDPPLEPLTPPSSYSVPQRTGKETREPTDHVYDRPVRRGSTRAAVVHSDEDDGVPRPPRTRRPERRRQSMVEPSYGQRRTPRMYSSAAEPKDEEVRPTTATATVASSYSGRHRRPTSYGRFHTSAPSESTRWSREGGF